MNVQEICKKAKEASYRLGNLTTETKNDMLKVMAEALTNNLDAIKQANKVDLDNFADKKSAFYDRLTINDDRINQMKEGLMQIIALPDPVGEVVEEFNLDSGLNIKKVRAPLGVIGIIYEARPNVTVDCVGLTLKSSNAVVLRGGKEAINTNRAIASAMKNALKEHGYDEDVMQFIDDTTHESSYELLQQEKYVDVIIPRGGEGLKKFILANAKMPVIASAGGNCHVYVEKTADFDIATRVILNAKTQRVSVCNALEHVLVDEEIASSFVPSIVKALREKNVTVKGDEFCSKFDGVLPMTSEDDDTEYLDYVISIRVVKGEKEAIEHINAHSTNHSEAIITKDGQKAEEFLRSVDSACVYVNTSTRFTDGFQFGFGAEMGISTQKLHARGPIALKELTSIKYNIVSDGAIREK